MRPGGVSCGSTNDPLGSSSSPGIPMGSDVRRKAPGGDDVGERLSESAGHMVGLRATIAVDPVAYPCSDVRPTGDPSGWIMGLDTVRLRCRTTGAPPPPPPEPAPATPAVALGVGDEWSSESGQCFR